MIKYRADYLSKHIDKKEVVKETEKAVFLPSLLRSPRKELKQSDHNAWFDTWEEAHQWLIAKATDRVEKTSEAHCKAVNERFEIMAMTES